MPNWVNQAYADYTKRLTHDWKIELIDIPLIKRTKRSNIADLIRRESERMLATIPKNNFVVALDEHGKEYDTIAFTNQLNQWKNANISPCFLIGGPDGLALECKHNAQAIWSLSKLTFPHSLTRVILAEQLYRAWSISANHPYHRS